MMGGIVADLDGATARRRPLRGRRVRLYGPARRQPARVELPQRVLRVRPARRPRRPRGARVAAGRPAGRTPRPAAGARDARGARADAGLVRTGGAHPPPRRPHPLARLIAAHALPREESRGAHARRDFPQTDPRLDGQHTVRPVRRGARARALGLPRAATRPVRPVGSESDRLLTNRSAINTNFIFVAFVPSHTGGRCGVHGTGEEASPGSCTRSAGDLPGAVTRRGGRRNAQSTSCAPASRRSAARRRPPLLRTAGPVAPPGGALLCCLPGPGPRLAGRGALPGGAPTAPGMSPGAPASTPTATRCRAARRPVAARPASDSRSTRTANPHSRQHLADTEASPPGPAPRRLTRPRRRPEPPPGPRGASGHARRAARRPSPAVLERTPFGGVVRPSSGSCSPSGRFCAARCARPHNDPRARGQPYHPVHGRRALPPEPGAGGHRGRLPRAPWWRRSPASVHPLVRAVHPVRRHRPRPGGRCRPS